MPPRLNFSTARNAVSILRQPPSSPLPVCGHNGASSSRRGVSSCLAGRQNASSFGFGVTARLPSSARVERRMNSSTSGAKDGERQSKDQLPHVSEEAAAIGKIMGEKRCDGTPATPELEQGTPVSEVSFLSFILQDNHEVADMIFLSSTRFSRATKKPKSTFPRS